jgi:flagellar basal-body rod protein FlgC
MSLFGALPISASGIDAAQEWINATGGNIANADDSGPTSEGTYATQYVDAIPVPSGQSDGIGQGVATKVELGSNEGDEEYDPGNPEADSQGMIRVANVDLGQQMVNLVMAQTSYQANVSVVNQAKTAYQSALTLGT